MIEIVEIIFIGIWLSIIDKEILSIKKKLIQLEWDLEIGKLAKDDIEK